MVISASDTAHISRISNDIGSWYFWCGECKTIADRILPAYLLSAYTRHLLEYAGKAGENTVTYSVIIGALGQITEIIMDVDYADIGTRAEIMDIFNRYGYSTLGQQKLEL